MGKIIKLTESDLLNLVKRVIKEQNQTKLTKTAPRATKNSAPEATIALENGGKVLRIKYESGLNPDEVYKVTTDYPATTQPKKVYAEYKGNFTFHLGDKKIPATIRREGLNEKNS